MKFNYGDSGDTSEHFTSLNFMSSSHIWYNPCM